MQHFHTVVIGGGPGGLACATKLAETGTDVLLVERKPRLGAKVCAGGITWSGLGSKLPPELVERSFTSQKVYSRWQKIKIGTATPIISTVNRQTLGQSMAGTAAAAGVTILPGTRVLAIGDRHVETTAGSFGYRYLVGADGSNSLVRRFLGIPTQQLGVGINCQVDSIFQEMEWHLNPRLFHSGYAWIFPHRHTASVGAYVSRQSMSASTLLENFHKWCQQRRIDLNGCRPRAAVINYDYRGWRFDNRFLVGDAAGLASGLTGEGIYPAIVSGETVARAIANPAATTDKLDRITARHRRHRRLLDFASRGRLAGSLATEALLLGLRSGLIPCDCLEMGADRPTATANGP